MRVRNIEENMQQAVEEAVNVLHSGGVIAYPTETSYGLGCDPRNLAALGKIYRIKSRATSKALPLVACSMEQVEKIFDVTNNVRGLVEKHWPGPLTVLLEPKDMSLRRSLPVFKDGLAAVRVSSHPFVHDLVCAYGFPLTATSANISDEEPCYSAQKVAEVFGEFDKARQPDLIIDGGELSETEASTIVRVAPDGKLEVLRQGVISLHFAEGEI